MRRFAVLFGLMVSILFALGDAQAQDDDYARVYSLIQDGDGLNTARRYGDARAKYLEAQSALERIHRQHPEWNPKVVEYRLGYLSSKINELAPKVAPPGETPPAAGGTSAPVQPTPPATGVGGVENQLNELQQQVRRLQSDKIILEAKLREALAAQPSNVDPREFVRAESTIRSLSKENELLKVNLAQHEPKTGTNDVSSADQLRRELAEANRQLALQTDKANTLAAETKELQSKLDNLIPATWNTTNIESTRIALAEANRQLAEQTDLAARAARQNESLQARTVSPSTASAAGPDANATAALLAENELLKRQLAALKLMTNGSSDEMTRHLSEAQIQITVLQSEKENLTRQNAELQKQTRSLAVPAVAVSAAATSESSSSSARVRQLERERDDLQRKLAAAQKELSGKKKGSTTTAHVDELAGELEIVRTRLAVYDAQRVPYSPEELALLRAPETPAPVDPKASKKASPALPASAVALLAEARRDFVAGRFDKAEQKYMEVLQQDDKNVYTLANLAAIELEMGHLDTAETNIQRAIAIAPDDAYSVMVLGQIRFQQQKYDESLNTLSRAAKLDPQNPAVQNALGLVLSQKGMRPAAETAFRKAVLIDPNYATAHNNLAVFYATQQPPSIPLARWHYQKALAAGLARNPDLEKMLEQPKTE